MSDLALGLSISTVQTVVFGSEWPCSTFLVETKQLGSSDANANHGRYLHISAPNHLKSFSQQDGKIFFKQ